MLLRLLLLLVSPRRRQRAPSRRGDVRLALGAPAIISRNAGRGSEACSATNASSPIRGGDGRSGTSRTSASGSHRRGPRTRDDTFQDRPSGSSVGLEKLSQRLAELDIRRGLFVEHMTKGSPQRIAGLLVVHSDDQLRVGRPDSVPGERARV